LFIAPSRQHVYALDNLTHVSDWLSDALCVPATGGGYGTRTLYENTEETIVDVVRPVILTAIYLNARQDLNDRVWPVTVPQLSDDQRLDEATVWQQFVALHPRLLGALCTAVSAALRHLPTTRVRATTRMADAVRWVTAAERGGGLPWAEGTVAGALTAQRLVQAQEAVLQSALADALVRLVTAAGGRWQGTALQLLRLVDDLVEPKERPQDWPRTVQALAAQLRRLSPELRRAGLLDVATTRVGHDRTRQLTLTRLASDPANQSRPEQKGQHTSATSARPHADAVNGGARPATPVDGTTADVGADVVGGTRPQHVRTTSAAHPDGVDGQEPVWTARDDDRRGADVADDADEVLRSSSAHDERAWEVFKP
jgi:hypothetical protein